MPVRERVTSLRAVVAVPAILLTVLGLIGQVLLDRSVLGAAGLATLAVPPILLATVLGRRRRRWPVRLLAALALTVALTVLMGVVAALSPHGLDAAAVAVLELVVLVLAFAVALSRGPRVAARRLSIIRHARRVPARGAPFTVRRGASIALLIAGPILAAGGVAIAASAAAANQAGDFVQLWSVPAVAREPTEIGVTNRTSATLECGLTLRRSGRDTVGIQVPSLAPGQTWTDRLSPADPSDVARWALALSCTGETEELARFLLIDPPGNPPLAAESVAP